MFTRFAVIAVLAAAAGTGAVAAGAATRTSAPPPELSAFVLAPADFQAGAVVESDKRTTMGGLPFFIRVFKPGASLGGRPLMGVVSLAILEPDAVRAASDFAQLDDATRTADGRQAYARDWGLAFVRGLGKTKVTVKKTVVGSAVHQGTNSLRVPMTIVTSRGTLRFSIGLVQVDRVLSMVELLGNYGQTIGSAAPNTALAAVQRRLQDGFAVANSAAPTIGGSAAQGQTLSADAGAWSGSPSTFTYSWSRCDSAGANCTAITGASAVTYTVGSADSGSTLRVTVVGKNSVSTQQADSAATAPVA